MLLLLDYNWLEKINPSSMQSRIIRVLLENILYYYIFIALYIRFPPSCNANSKTDNHKCRLTWSYNGCAQQLCSVNTSVQDTITLVKKGTQKQNGFKVTLQSNLRVTSVSLYGNHANLLKLVAKKRRRCKNGFITSMIFNINDYSVFRSMVTMATLCTLCKMYFMTNWCPLRRVFKADHQNVARITPNKLLLASRAGVQ